MLGLVVIAFTFRLSCWRAVYFTRVFANSRKWPTPLKHQKGIHRGDNGPSPIVFQSIHLPVPSSNPIPWVWVSNDSPFLFSSPHLNNRQPVGLIFRSLCLLKKPKSRLILSIMCVCVKLLPEWQWAKEGERRFLFFLLLVERRPLITRDLFVSQPRLVRFNKRRRCCRSHPGYTHLKPSRSLLMYSWYEMSWSLPKWIPLTDGLAITSQESHR